MGKCIKEIRKSDIVNAGVKILVFACEILAIICTDLDIYIHVQVVNFKITLLICIIC